MRPNKPQCACLGRLGRLQDGHRCQSGKSKPKHPSRQPNRSKNSGRQKSGRSRLPSALTFEAALSQDATPNISRGEPGHWEHLDNGWHLRDLVREQNKVDARPRFLQSQNEWRVFKNIAAVVLYRCRGPPIHSRAAVSAVGRTEWPRCGVIMGARERSVTWSSDTSPLWSSPCVLCPQVSTIQSTQLVGSMGNYDGEGSERRQSSARGYGDTWDGGNVVKADSCN